MLVKRAESFILQVGRSKFLQMAHKNETGNFPRKNESNIGYTPKRFQNQAKQFGQ